MTADQATALREKLLAMRTQLLDYATQQAEVNPPSPGWLSMVADVQAALKAVEEAAGQPVAELRRVVNVDGDLAYQKMGV